MLILYLIYTSQEWNGIYQYNVYRPIYIGLLIIEYRKGIIKDSVTRHFGKSIVIDLFDASWITPM